MTRRVLITGGAGFIGSSVALGLRKRTPDWDVVVLDNLFRRGSEMNLPRLREAGVEFLHGDVRQPEDLARVGHFDAMVECSAEPSVMAAGDVVVPVNLFGAYHCFEAARDHGAQVVFLSTSRVYPMAPLLALPFRESATRFELEAGHGLPGVGAEGVSEQMPLAGARTMYGATKLAAELLLAEYDIPWVANRCGVVAGPWQLGKVDQGVFTHWLLSFTFDRALAYIGFGGTGKQVRDLLHVEDLVDLVHLQLAAPQEWAGRTVNVGGGREGSLSLLETTELCREITGHELQVGSDPVTRPGDVPWYLSDCSALHAVSEWRPQRGPRQILTDVHAWLVDNQTLIQRTL